ncbi:TniB family NTP-binding protein [Pikeienuella sp. HZG-20]|uniref:TniB family NTP-binding protein n=1 Tax=Paludibacillus litoralis TaxID=3133267 RepID=UPI0030EEF471
MTRPRKTKFEIQTILDDLRNTYVGTPRDQLFLSHLDRLLKCDEHGALLPRPVTFTETGETRGIALVDGPGGGKTSLVKHNLRHHPAFASPRANTAPIVAASVPSPATLKSLALEIIRETGFPAPSSRTSAWELWRLVRVRLQCCGAVVLWIDEAHDLFRKRSASEVEDMLRMLKSLMQGDGAVIVILTGVDALWRIASYDDQVKRRYSKIELPPISNVKDGKALAKQIATFCARTGLAPPTEPDPIPRLIFASRERFGR